MAKNVPVIPWIGGKRRLAKHLLPLFPDHKCYVELFCGACALFFARPPADVEVINDINGDVVNLYRVIRHHASDSGQNDDHPQRPHRHSSAVCGFQCRVGRYQLHRRWWPRLPQGRQGANYPVMVTLRHTRARHVNGKSGCIFYQY